MAPGSPPEQIERRQASNFDQAIGTNSRGWVCERLAVLVLDIRTLKQATEVPLRQSDIAGLLAVRRAATAGGKFQAAGAISARRAAIRLCDLDAVAQAATDVGWPHSTVTDLARLRG